MSKKNSQNFSEEVFATLKNMLQENKKNQDQLASHDDIELIADYVKNFEDNFFTWQEQLISINQSLKKQISYQIPIAEILNNQSKNFDKEKIELARFSANIAFSFLKYHNQQTNNYTDNFNQIKSKLNQDQLQIFNEFNKVRCLIKSSDCYLGVANNLLNNIDSNLEHSSINPLALILLKLENNTNSLLKNFAITDQFCQNLINKSDPSIIEKLFKILNLIDDQVEFNNHVFELILSLNKADQKTDENQNKNSSQDNLQKSTDSVSNNVENIEQKLFEQEDQVSSGSQQKIEQNLELQTEKNCEDFSDNNQQDQVLSDSIDPKLIGFKSSYKIYTSKFDEIIFPEKLINKNELKNLRLQLDLKIKKMIKISSKMSLKLKRKLISKNNQTISQNSSLGNINRKKLTSLIINPQIEDIWLNQKQHQYQDTALTILLDNSGSMRGNPIVMSALACEIIADILQNFSIKTEIIGFTTGDWKGGRARRLWEMSSRPVNPGRLNELRHIIYKQFNQNFSRARINLGLMLKEGILKENIDGEALLFARSRLIQQSEKRKILLVISDGTPVDDSTSSCNSEDILSQHLHQVINKIEKQAKIELVAIGIGHSTEEFYRNSITIKNLEELGDVMIDRIANLL
jgi:cobaltochelatase CobT